MSVKSAKTGTVSWKGTPATDVTDIKVNKSSDVKEYASSSTAGKKRRIAGHSDATGSFTVLNDSKATFVKGDHGTLLVKSDSSTTMYNGTVIIISAEYSVPVGDGGPCEINVTWGAAPNLA